MGFKCDWVWILGTSQFSLPRKLNLILNSDWVMRCRWLWHTRAVHPWCCVGEDSLLIQVSPTLEGFFCRVSVLLFPPFEFRSSGIILHISNLQFTVDYFVKTIENKASSPRDCTWHCNTSWTGEEEPFPIGRLVLKHFPYFLPSSSKYNPPKRNENKKWLPDVDGNVIVYNIYGVRSTLCTILHSKKSWLLHHWQS
jgi:hypothetical protein